MGYYGRQASDNMDFVAVGISWLCRLQFCGSLGLSVG
jgi:hypothetical protein